MKPNHPAWAIYKSFVTLAITGLQQHADAIMASHSAAIERVASHLRTILPIRPKTLYRGLLLDPSTPDGAQLSTYKSAQYFSFSENLEVACWFASPDAIMGSVYRQSFPTHVGYIAEFTPAPYQILFHYSWADYINQLDPNDNLYVTLMNIITAMNLESEKDPKEAVTEFYFHLKHQQEVICKSNVKLIVRKESHYNCPDAQTLDNKYNPRPDFIIAPPGMQSIGVQPGTKIYLKGAEFYQTPRACPNCQKQGVKVIYLLDIPGFPNAKNYQCTACDQHIITL